jgi:hypothetical protein
MSGVRVPFVFNASDSALHIESLRAIRSTSNAMMPVSSTIGGIKNDGHTSASFVCHSAQFCLFLERAGSQKLHGNSKPYWQ